MLTDLAFGADGSLYVLQHASGIPGAVPVRSPGAVRKVQPGGGGTSTLVADGLPERRASQSAMTRRSTSRSTARRRATAVWRIVP